MNLLRILLLFVLIMPMSSTFVACRKDSDVAPSIVGKWERLAFQYRIVYEVSGSKYDKIGTRNNQGTIVEFREDGTATEQGSNYTYTISGDQLTVRYGSVTTTFKIILTGDQLTLEGTENMISGLSEADKIKEAKGWASEINGSGVGNGIYTDINKATKAAEVYESSSYQRVK